MILFIVIQIGPIKNKDENVVNCPIAVVCFVSSG